MTNLTIFDLLKASQEALPITFTIEDVKGNTKRINGFIRINGSLFYIHEDKTGSANHTIPASIPEMFMVLESLDVKTRKETPAK